MQAVKMYTTAWCPYCIRAKQLLKAKGASVASFTLYIVGEGIEKKVTDFAAEVAEQAAAAAKK